MRTDPSASRFRPAVRGVPWGWHVAALSVLALAGLANSWKWFSADRMPLGDFPGYAAQVRYVRDALLQHGRVPLWCVECYGGTTDFTSHLKEYLVFPLAVWSDSVLATKLGFVVLRWLAALGLYALVVRFFRAPLVGLIAGYAYAFGAVANHQNEHLDMALAGALAPPILLASVELLRRGGVRWALALGVLEACQLLNNWVYALAAPVALLLLLVLRPWREQPGEADPWRDRRLAVRWLWLGAATLAVFLVFAGSQLAWIASDARNHRLIPSRAIGSLQEVYVEYSPFLFFNRNDVLRPWLERHHPPGFGRWLVWDRGGRYLGVLVLAVCLGGWLAMRRDARWRRWSALAAGMFGFQYWLSLGPRTLLWELAESLHWTPQAQGMLRAGMLVGSGACLLLAIGTGLVLRSRGAARGIGPRLLLAALLLFAPTHSLWNLAARGLPMLALQRSPGHFFDTSAFWLCLLFAIALVAIQRSLRRPQLARLLLAGLALGVAVDFWPSTRRFSEGVPLASLRPATELLEGLDGDGGTLRLGLSQAYSPLASWLAGQAPTGYAWGWLPWQAGRYWGGFFTAAVGQAAAAAAPDAPARLDADVELLALARIRYFLLDQQGVDARTLPPPWRRVRSAEGLALWEQSEVVPVGSGYRAYVLMDDTPRADAAAVAAAALRENALALSAGPRLPELREGARAILSPDGLPRPWEQDPVSGAAWLERLRSPPAPPPFAARARRPQPERIVLEARAGDAPAMLFVSEGYHPWWRATVDDRPAPVLRAQLAFMAVPIGPGSHRIELRLERPALVATADRISGAAWLALLLAAPGSVLWRLRQARRIC